jgi:hypothetical protein
VKNPEASSSGLLLAVIANVCSDMLTLSESIRVLFSHMSSFANCGWHEREQRFSGRCSVVVRNPKP